MMLCAEVPDGGLREFDRPGTDLAIPAVRLGIREEESQVEDSERRESTEYKSVSGRARRAIYFLDNRFALDCRDLMNNIKERSWRDHA